MKNKDRKRLKKKEKIKQSVDKDKKSIVLSLKQQIKKLEKELRRRESIIEELTRKIKQKGDKKKKKIKGRSATKILRAQRLTRVGVEQRGAWKQHGYLRDRYEFYLKNGEEKELARKLANSDLRAKFGEDEGYSEEELEYILS